MANPLVSILIPCYNAEPWITETLDCLKAQTYANLEIIIVDDGSKDGSCDVIEAFTDDRIRLIRQTNSGAAHARNVAFEASRGDFIQFLDADDLLSTNKIEAQLARLEGHSDCVASCKWARFIKSRSEASFSSNSTWKDQKPLEWLLANWHDGGSMLFPALWLIPRAVAIKAGPWDESLVQNPNDDGEYFTRVVLAAKEVLFCEESECYYRSGITGSYSTLKTRASWESQFKTINIWEDQLTSRENSERVRRVLSILWQNFAHASYPYQPDLAELAILRARNLHQVIVQPGGGRSFRSLSKLVGWRLARSLQHKYYQMRYSK